MMKENESGNGSQSGDVELVEGRNDVTRIATTRINKGVTANRTAKRESNTNPLKNDTSVSQRVGGSEKETALQRNSADETRILKKKPKRPGVAKDADKTRIERRKSKMHANSGAQSSGDASRETESDRTQFQPARRDSSEQTVIDKRKDQNATDYFSPAEGEYCIKCGKKLK